MGDAVERALVRPVEQRLAAFKEKTSRPKGLHGRLAGAWAGYSLDARLTQVQRCMLVRVWKT